MSEMIRIIRGRGATFKNQNSLRYEGPGEGSNPPSVSGSIQLSTLPAGPEIVIPAVWACSDGVSPFHHVLGNVTAERIILVPKLCRFWALARALARPQSGPSFSWRGEFPQQEQVPPSAALPLLAMSSKGVRYKILVAKLVQYHW